MLEELKILSTRAYIPPSNLALVYAAFGQRDECFIWLEKAYQDRDVRLSILKADPKWDSVRSDPRFASILKRIGLATSPHRNRSTDFGKPALRGVVGMQPGSFRRFSALRRATADALVGCQKQRLDWPD